MKKMLLLLLMVATLQADEYDRFMVDGKARGSGQIVDVQIAYAWLEVPLAMLDTPIPAEAELLIYGEVLEDWTLRDFALSVQELETTAIISISANHKITGNKSRQKWTTKEDLGLWCYFLAPYGYTVADLMDITQYHARLAELGEEQ